MSFDKIFDLTAGVYFHFIIYYKKGGNEEHDWRLQVVILLTVELGTGCFSQHRLYCGKTQSVYWTAAVYWPSVRRSIARPRLVRGAHWRGRRRLQLCAFSRIFPSQSGLKTVLVGDGCGGLQRKKSSTRFVEKGAFNVWRWCDVLHSCRWRSRRCGKNNSDVVYPS